MQKYLPPIIYSCDLSKEQRSLVEQSFLLSRWLGRVQDKFVLQNLQVQSADFVNRKGKPCLLFLKIKVQATDVQGRKVPSVVLLRGDAVGILVVLHCQGQRYLLLVDQARFPIGALHTLEIPAGILDWSQDPREVAVEELHEEVGLAVEKHELVDLGAELLQHPDKCFSTSCGLLDEHIYLFLLERCVNQKELEALNGKAQEYSEEDEGIKTVVMPFEQAWPQFNDGKNFIALWLYERWLARQGRHA